MALTVHGMENALLNMMVEEMFFFVCCNRVSLFLVFWFFMSSVSPPDRFPFVARDTNGKRSLEQDSKKSVRRCPNRTVGTDMNKFDMMSETSTVICSNAIYLF